MKDRNFVSPDKNYKPVLRIVPYPRGYRNGWFTYQVQKRVCFFFWKPISPAFREMSKAADFIELYLEGKEECFDL